MISACLLPRTCMKPLSAGNKQTEKYKYKGGNNYGKS